MERKHINLFVRDDVIGAIFSSIVREYATQKFDSVTVSYSEYTDQFSQKVKDLIELVKLADLQGKNPCCERLILIIGFKVKKRSIIEWKRALNSLDNKVHVHVIGYSIFNEKRGLFKLLRWLRWNGFKETKCPIEAAIKSIRDVDRIWGSLEFIREYIGGTEEFSFAFSSYLNDNPNLNEFVIDQFDDYCISYRLEQIHNGGNYFGKEEKQL